MTSELSKEIRSEFRALFERVDKEKPVKKDLTAFRSMLTEHPGLLDLIGGLAEQNISRLLADTKMSEGVREMFRADLNRMHIDLGYDDAPMLEKMLIDSVMLAWLRLNFYEYKITELDIQGMTLEKASFWDKRLSAAQSRYLRACRTLAQVRRLARNIPALQVNINTDAGQQVNVLGDLNKAPSQE